MPSSYGAFTLSGLLFQNSSISASYTLCKSYNPISFYKYGLGSFAFARHYSRNHYYFLLLWVLRCFSSPRSPSFDYPVFNWMGSPIRISMDLRSFAAPHSFSQLTTSFIASESLGIHHAPLFRFLSFIINPTLFQVPSS